MYIKLFAVLAIVAFANRTNAQQSNGDCVMLGLQAQQNLPNVSMRGNVYGSLGFTKHLGAFLSLRFADQWADPHVGLKYFSTYRGINLSISYGIGATTIDETNSMRKTQGFRITHGGYLFVDKLSGKTTKGRIQGSLSIEQGPSALPSLNVDLDELHLAEQRGVWFMAYGMYGITKYISAGIHAERFFTQGTDNVDFYPSSSTKPQEWNYYKWFGGQKETRRLSVFGPRFQVDVPLHKVSKGMLPKYFLRLYVVPGIDLGTTKFANIASVQFIFTH